MSVPSFLDLIRYAMPVLPGLEAFTTKNDIPSLYLHERLKWLTECIGSARYPVLQDRIPTGF